MKALFIIIAALMLLPAGLSAQDQTVQTKYVALSFDDGPNNTITPQILDLLKKNDIKASFYLIGRNINRKTARVMRRMVKMGCDVENHTFSHPHLPEITPEEMLEQVNSTDELIIKYAKVKPTMLRPPYLHFTKKVANTIPDKIFIGGLSSKDWDESLTAEQINNIILKGVKDGEILLFHDTKQHTVEALEVLIPKLKSMGYEFVTVSELFKVKGRNPGSHEFKRYDRVN